LRPTTPGATHASDVAYTFGTLGAVDPKASDADRAAAGRVAGYWANFVRSHDPNGAGLPDWPQAGAAAEPLLVIGNDRTTAGPETRTIRLDALEGSIAK
jgi:para-nitrobenzyl esterase